MFEGKTALVTGASSGIGLAVASGLRSLGAEVIATDLAPAEGVLSLDVTDESAWAGLAKPLDILVASAGVSHAAPLAEMRAADWRRVLDVNLTGAFLAVRHGLRHMPRGGSIVLLGSASGIKVSPGAAAYSTSKAGLLMLARAAAVEGKPLGIRVNAVSPAGVVTPMWTKMPFWENLVREQGGEAGAWKALGGADPSTPPLERMALPAEVARAVLFLCGPDAAAITGANLVMDAGYTLT